MNIYLTMNKFLQLIYRLLGRRFFSGRQPWQQQRNAKIMLLTVGFALILGFAMSKIFRFLYNHQ
jgi:hypothetical protein